MPTILESKLIDIYKRAGADALNKLATQARTLAINEIYWAYPTVSAKAIRDRIIIDKATPDRLYALITVGGKKNRIPLIAFGAKQLGSGTVVSVRPDRSTFIRHAFIQTMQSGHRGVFMRKGVQRLVTRGRYAGTGLKREPIVEMAGPGVKGMYQGAELPDKVKEFATRNLPAILEHEMKFRLRGVR
jgi:hypothetical protein